MTVKPFNKFDATFTFEQNVFAAPVEPGKATPAGKRILACGHDPARGVHAANRWLRADRRVSSEACGQAITRLARLTQVTASAGRVLPEP